MSPETKTEAKQDNDLFQFPAFYIQNWKLCSLHDNKKHEHIMPRLNNSMGTWLTLLLLQMDQHSHWSLYIQILVWYADYKDIECLNLTKQVVDADRLDLTTDFQWSFKI